MTLLVVVAAYALSTLWRPEPGYVPVLDGWLRLTGHVLVAVVAVLRPLRSRVDRALWTAVAFALVARSTGVISFAVLVRPSDEPTFPSIADAWWLSTCVALSVAIGTRIVTRRRATPTPLVLDGVVAGFAVAAVAVAYITPTVAELADAPSASSAAVVVNLAYLVFDAVFLGTLAGMLTAGGRSSSPALRLFTGGIALLAAVDVVYLQITVTGGFGDAAWLSPLSALSLSASVAIAAAAWAPDPPPTYGDELPRSVLPAVTALVCLAVVVAASWVPVGTVAVTLATGGLLVTIGRTLLSFRILRTAAALRREIRTDDLTGIANRRACVEVLTRLLERGDGAEVSLLVLDLDGFRAINEARGHHHGDQVLRVLTDRLAGAIREGDLVARLGSDEFAIVLPGADPVAAAVAAERTLATVRHPIRIGDTVHDLDASIGIASAPQDASDAAELLRLADLAMTDGKRSGAGPQRYDAARHVSADARRRAIEELRRGIERHELVAHFQPQVELTTGRILGVEALVRWHHPDRGVRPPQEFLPLTEASGLSRALTASVLEQAIARSAAWRRAGHRITTAVNLSVTDLLDLELPRQLDRLLDRHGLAPEALTLELTENLFIVDPGRAQRVIDALFERGLRLFVDDYGTGFSSVGYLRDLEGLAGLKLDRSYVARLETDRRARAIVSSTVSMATELGLEVVGEGIETETARAILVDLGCRVGQGYLFSPPRPGDELALDRTFPPVTRAG